MRSLKDISGEELLGLLKSWGQPAFRAKQIRAWLYAPRFAASYDEMNNLPAVLRAQLSEAALPFSLKVVKTLTDPADGTVKWLSELADGNTIETVLIRVPRRTTVCVSTQVGCAVQCVFCASGRGGLVRNLSKAEIIDQVVLACRELGERVDNVVVMGMGEPLMNLDNLVAALDELGSPEAIDLGNRHVTISTSGIVPGIRQLAELRRSWNLALSLHAVTDAERARIIPGPNRYPLAEIFAACEYHRELTNRMLTLEYALIAGRNDDRATLAQLSEIARRLHAKVNLIPCNPNASNCKSPGLRRCREALAFLEDSGVQASLRLSHGQGILAACGQLRQASS
ncbi:MAG: 23S rRNA (adenine(2503)-C(2))-methyltransferase RlmN [Victivallales bacterium]|nr:23S rRNA (adenine(2503)-C(2))-methyltransferase RlmN [Victivallales bacterium]